MESLLLIASQGVYGWMVDASGAGSDEGRGQAAKSPGEVPGNL